MSVQAALPNYDLPGIYGWQVVIEEGKLPPNKFATFTFNQSLDKFYLFCIAKMIQRISDSFYTVSMIIERSRNN